MSPSIRCSAVAAAVVVGAWVGSIAPVHLEAQTRPLDYPATLTERYQALRVEDLQSAASDVVQPDSLTWLIVVDIGAIRDQVEAVGIAPIEAWNVDGEPVR